MGGYSFLEFFYSVAGLLFILFAFSLYFNDFSLFLFVVQLFFALIVAFIAAFSLLLVFLQGFLPLTFFWEFSCWHAFTISGSFCHTLRLHSLYWLFFSELKNQFIRFHFLRLFPVRNFLQCNFQFFPLLLFF